MARGRWPAGFVGIVVLALFDRAHGATMLPCNVTSMEHRWGALRGAAWGLLVCQEVRVLWGADCIVDACAQGFDAILGEAGDDDKALLACVARQGRMVRREAPVGRMPVGGVLRVYNIYLPPGHGAEVRACATAQACVVDAMRTPAVPAVISGDFNAELREQPLEALLGQSGWADPLGHVATSTAAAVPRRIDWLLMNAAARQGFRPWRDLGLPVHVAHEVVLARRVGGGSAGLTGAAAPTAGQPRGAGYGSGG